MTYKWIGILAVLAIAACSSVPVALDAAQVVPADRVLSHQSPIPGGGMITVVRDGGAGTSPCYAGVFVGGSLVAKVGRAERVAIYLPAGRSVVAAHLVGDGLCGWGINKRGERATAVQIATGDSFTYRIASDGNGVMSITPLN
jgi:hypothetical protein